MSSTMGWAPPSRARLPLAAVALVHLLVVGFWWVATHRPLPAPARNEPRPLLLRWLPLAMPAPRAEAPPPQPRQQRMATPHRLQAPEPAPITLPPLEPAAAPQPAPPPSAAASAPPPAPLDLRLPTGPTATWRQRPAARDDPRANTPRPTLERKLEQALGGDGQWREERVDNDRVMFRRGGECIIATRSRAGQLELAGGAFRNLWSVREC